MGRFNLNTVLHFNSDSPHPSSKIIGIDHYDFNSQDGKNRHWESYTMVPINQKDCQGDYNRWYIVDLPEMGLSFVTSINENLIPDGLVSDLRITGNGTSIIEGDGDFGNGTIKLVSHRDQKTTPETMYTKEIFEDGSTMHLKTIPLVGLKTP
jgi:hypothetical protein